MIYPTARAVGLAAAGAPLALMLGVFAPHLWLLGPAWLAFAFALVLIDARLGADRMGVELSLTAPRAAAAGTRPDALLQAAFGAAAPGAVELALDVDGPIEANPARAVAMPAEGLARSRFVLSPRRRGRAVIAKAWARWRGPLGLVWKQKVETVDHELLLTLNIQSVKDEAMRLYLRDAPAGQRIQPELGGGSDFHALAEFRAGMDRRTIDWKRSASRGELLAKEFHTERNHHVILVVDTGRSMCEPVGGLARLDHALNASLLMAFVALKGGDRAGLFGFDAKPNLRTGALSGLSAFAQIQRLAAGVDYSDRETNYTLGLTELSATLHRRSLLVVFTEFTDTTSAELMLETVGRLLDQHVVVFVVMRDDELDALERRRPETPEDVSRAVVAAALLREREIVVERLRRLGVEIVEAPAARIGPALIARYLDLKRRDQL